MEDGGKRYYTAEMTFSILNGFIEEVTQYAQCPNITSVH